MEVNSFAFSSCLLDTNFVSSLFALLAFVPVIVVCVVCCVYNLFVHGWEDVLGHWTMSSSLATWTSSPLSDTEGPLLMTGCVQFIVYLDIVSVFGRRGSIAHDRA
jgi:hypothetical protein